MEDGSSHWSHNRRMTHEVLREKRSGWRATRRSKELDEFGFVDHSIIVSIFASLQAYTKSLSTELISRVGSEAVRLQR